MKHNNNLSSISLFKFGVCMCLWVSLTEHSDVDAVRGSLVFDALTDVADVVSTLGHRGMREYPVGAHVRWGDICQRLCFFNSL